MTTYLVTFNIRISGFKTPVTVNRVVLADNFSSACIDADGLVEREIGFYLEWYGKSRTVTGAVTKIEVLK